MRRLLIAAISVAAVVFSATAFAAGSTPSNAVYSSTGPKTQQALGASKPTTSHSPATVEAATAAAHVAAAQPASSGAQLPFTGLDLTLIVGAGLVLVAMGFSLRRITRRPPS